MIELDYDENQRAIGDAVDSYCRARCDATWVRENAGRFEAARWRELGELGVWGLGSPLGEGGLLEATAAAEVLGRASFPGPVVETALAARCLLDEELEALVAGEALAGLGEDGLFSFGPDARWLFELGPEGLRRVEFEGDLEPVTTLAGEVWGRRAERGSAARFDPVASEAGSQALDAGRCVASAVLVGAATSLLDAAAEHARTRRQFGRAIGEFQAVAHPLAEVWVGLETAGLLLRQAAARLDQGEPAGHVLAAAAWTAARDAALSAAFSAHQVFGAVGITLEGPAFHASRRIRQIASLPIQHGAADTVLTQLVGRGAGLPEASR